MQKLGTLLFVGVAAMAPVVTHAVTLGNTISTISKIINSLIPIVLAIAVLVFFWGLVKYLMSADKPESRNEGLNLMFMGIIALFVMVSIWGIIRILQQTFQVEQGTPIVPQPIERRF